MKRILIVLTTLFLFTKINSQVLQKVTFVPHWAPQAQFAGYYVAKDLGIYKNHGIDLTIITCGPKVSSYSLSVAKRLYINRLIERIPSYYEIYKPIKLSKEK